MQHAVHDRATVRVADRTDVSGRVTASSINDGSRAKRQGSLWRISDWEESPMTQLRRGVVGVIAALVVVSLSFSAQAAEKKKVMGTDKSGPVISRTVVPLGPGEVRSMHWSSWRSIESPPRVRTRILTGQT